jgi:heme-degrading monooxygenase HmoA
MFAVIFEVQPKKERWTDYLDLAGLLRPELKKIDGFIDNERFISLRDRGRVLSLSTWRDEKALIRWRTLAFHHDAQEKGRSIIFEDYHLRVGELVADTHIPQKFWSPSATLRRDRNRRRQAGHNQRISSARRRPGGQRRARSRSRPADGGSR